MAGLHCFGRSAITSVYKGIPRLNLRKAYFMTAAANRCGVKPWGVNKMKTYLALSVCGVVLAGCSASGNNSAFLNNGNDTSFLQQGSSSCPGVAQSNNPIYDRYPLRCGPQAQMIPR